MIVFFPNSGESLTRDIFGLMQAEICSAKTKFRTPSGLKTAMKMTIFEMTTSH